MHQAEPVGGGHEPDHPHGHGPDHEHHEHPGGLRDKLIHLLRPHSHDAADSVDAALEASSRGIRAVKISLVGLAITALLQLVVVYFSGSVALLADTIHNFSDATTAIPLWIAFVLGRRAATRTYTYGFGRAEDVAGLFVIAMIALSAVVAAWQAIDRLVHPAPMTRLAWVAAAGVIGFAGNEAVALFRIREGRAIGSAALIADGQHARTDGLTSLAVVLSAAGVAIGWAWADPVIGLVITLAILAVLRVAAREVFRRLLDGIDPALVARAEVLLAAVPGVVRVRRVRMRWVGHEVVAEVDLDVDPGIGLAAAHAIAHRAEQALIAQPGSRVTTATVHAYPAHPAVD